MSQSFQTMRERTVPIGQGTPLKVEATLAPCSTPGCDVRILIELAMGNRDHRPIVETTCWNCLSDDEKVHVSEVYGIPIN